MIGSKVMATRLDGFFLVAKGEYISAMERDSFYESKCAYGQFHIKSPRKKSTSKTNFFMMKYEITKGYEKVFTVSNPNFSFGANLGQKLK